MKKYLLTYFFILFFSPHIIAQLCTGSLGDPVVEFTFGKGTANPGPPLPAGITTYRYSTNQSMGDGEYTISNLSLNGHEGTWFSITDHTPDDVGGYMMVVNAAIDPGVFYVQRVDGLCSSTTYEFAAWIMNILKASACAGRGINPDLTFTIERLNGTILNSYSTGNIPQTTSSVWRQYGFYFQMPPDATSVIIRIRNNAGGGCGNDLALDDITFRPCGPTLTMTAAPTSEQCQNNIVPVTLNATISTGYANPSFQWEESRDNGDTWQDIPGATSTNYVYTPPGAGTYMLRISASEAGNIGSLKCRINSNEITINVRPAPDIDAGIDKAICMGGAVTLTATGASAGAKFLWTPSSGLSDNRIANPVASPTTTTTYNVQATYTNGCVGTDDVTVTVNPLPEVNAGLDIAICAGASTQLQASGARTYTWSPATGLNNANIANPIAKPAATTTYMVTGTDINGCVANDAMVVTVNPNPIVNTSEPVTVCVGTDVQLNASGADTYKWIPATGLSDPDIANPIASPVVTTTYTVTGTDGNGCSASDNVLITVRPVPGINAGNDVSICKGASVTLHATGGASYQWSPATGLSDPNIASPIATPEVTTTYTVTGTGPYGCVNTDQVTVTVNALPDINAGNDAAICKGLTTQLQASGGVGYKWSPATGLSNASIANPRAGPLVNTTYTVTGTDINGCKATDEVFITVNPLPPISAGRDEIICSGETVQLHVTGGSIGTTYLWKPSTGLSDPTITDPFATPLANTTYTVTATDENGCTNADATQITVRSLPAISAGNNIAICLGNATTLHATGGNSYQWTPATGLSNPNIANPVANPDVTTTYTVTGTITGGCSNTSQVTVTVNELPVVSAGDDVTTCKGTAVKLNATGANSYQWSPATGLSNVNIASPNANPSTTTTYSVTGTDINGCKATDAVLVNVNPLPQISVGQDQAICSGASVQLHVTGGNNTTTYLWKPATGLSDPTSMDPFARPAITTNYTVTATDENGCSSSDATLITVHPLPAISAGADVAICDGKSTTLHATGGISYVWTPATGLSNPNSTSPVAQPDETTTYTLTGKSADGCSNTDQVTVTVNPLPTITASDDATICKGSSTTLQASGGVAYSWSPATGLSNANIANPVATPLVTTTYTVTGIDINGCSNTARVTVMVNPVPTISAGSDAAICTGSSTTLHATGGISYVWSPAAGLSDINVADPIATPLVTTTYMVTGTGANGCTNKDQVTVTVNPIPAISAGDDAAICNGSSTTLHATGGATYSWSPATGLSDPNSANPIAKPTATTTYTVTGKSSVGCSNTDEVIITVNELPTIVAGDDITICKEASATLQATGGITYSWSPATGLSNANIANPVASPAITTTYTVTGTDANGCKNTDAVTVNVQPLPSISAGSDVAICAGGSTTLKATGGESYTWSPAASLSDPISAQPVASPTVTTTYTVTGTGTNGCSNKDQVTVTVNQLPNIDAGNDTAICTGSSATLQATGGTTYSWSPATGLSNPNIANPVAKPTATITYTVNGKDAKGCSNTDEIMVTVNPLPVINAGADITICKGTSTTLQANGGVTYSWSPVSDLSDPNIANPVATPDINTTYTVTGTDENGCSNKDQVIITVDPAPPVKAGNDVVICIGSSTILQATGGSTYAWSPATGLSDPNIANPIANPAITTVYTVTGTDTKGCSSTDKVTVTVNKLPAISAGTDVGVCIGSSITLRATGGTSYSWSPTTGLSNASIANPIASPAVTTTYTVTGTDANGCTNKDEVIVTVNPLPTISAGADAIICAGLSTTLQASGGTSYSWTPTIGLSNPNIANPIASPVITTTYTVTGTDANGCTNTDQVVVTVNPLPTISAGSDVAICAGLSTTLQASGGTSYSWSPVTGLSDPTVANPIASPTVTTTYTVTGINSANGCSNTDQVIVTVNPLPIINAGADVAICSGLSTTLQARGGTSYVWSPTTGLSNASIANPIASPAITTTYTVTGTDANGCTNTDVVIVTVNPLPTINAGADATICAGLSTTLQASGGTSYSWSPSTGLSNPNIANPIASPTVTTTYTVTGTDANGCTNTDQVIVTVNPLPTISAGADVAICAGLSATLQATGGTSYSWSPTTGLSDPNIANPIASPTVTTTYTVTGINSANGCSNTDQVTVTVNPLPIINAGADVAICSGLSTTLQATGGMSYIWSPTTGLSNASIANPIASPTITTTYTVTGKDANGCTNTDDVIVTVNPLPTINAGADAIICAGLSTTLQASGGITYSWSPTTGLSDPNIANPVASPAITTTYTVTGTDANGCTNTDQVIVTVNPLPTISAGADVAICAGLSTTLQATGGTSYSWSPTTGLSDPNIANPIASPAVTTTYTVTGINSANGCSNTDQVIVTVNPLPIINAGADVAICAGLSTTLRATGGTSYSWSPTTGLSNANIANPIASPAITTTYTVTGTDVNGCLNKDEVIVTVNPLPTISAGADATICAGLSTTLQASGGISYSWNPSTGLSDPNIANPVASPAITTTYTVTGTDANGCINTDQIVVTVNPLPTISAGADVAICAGLSTTLQATGGTSYSWSPVTGLSDPNIANPIASPTVTTTYTVTGINSANGCSNTDQVIVTVNPLPVIGAGTDVAICAGLSTTLQATGGTSYSWSPTTGLSNAAIANPIASPTVTTTYTVTGKDINGCVNTDEIIVTVNPLPTIGAGADATICTGTSTTLQASGGITYSWSPTFGLSDPNIANPIASPATTTTYTLTGTDVNSCTNTDQVVVTVNPLPTISAGADVAICAGLSTTLQATGGTSYSWSPTTGLSDPNIANPIASPTVTTPYSVTGINSANGCSNTDQIVVTVNPLPIIGAGADVAICAGLSTTLQATGGTSYSWSPTTGLSNASIANPIASPAVTTTYTVTGTDANGCLNKDEVIVTVNPLPTISAGADAIICAGLSTTLQASGGIAYSWSPTTGLSDPNIANPIASPVITTTYTVTGTDANGCRNTDRVVVTVNPLPTISAGADVAICAGLSTTLQATGGTSYSWSPTTGLSDPNIANPIASPAVTTTYTVTGINSANGCGNTDQVVVTVNPLPIINAGADVAICSGLSTTLQASGGTSYSWSPTTGLSNASIANPIASPAVTTTYTVTGTDANGCLNKDEVIVTVNPLPTISAGADAIICAGLSTTLQASGGIAYSWSPSTGLSNPNIANPVASPAITTTYTVTGTDANGCSNTDVITITVNPVITVGAGDDATICSGNSVTLHATGARDYLWSPATGLSDPTVANPIASPLVTTTYTVTVMSSNGCASSDDVTITVNPSPVVIAGVDVAICLGSTAALNASGADTYTWIPAAYLSDPGIANPVASPSVTTTYTVTGKTANGCIGTDDVLVTVNTIPLISAGKDTAICVGGVATLQASGGVSYVWSPATGLSNPNIPNPVAAPVGTTTYTILGTDANGCSKTDQVIVTINPVAGVNAGNDVTMCPGASTTLLATGASSYTWSPADGLSDPAIANPVASPTTTTTYTVVGRGATGCTNTDQVTVNVYPVPVINAGSDVAICLQTSITLEATGGALYTWSPVEGLSNPGIANPVASPLVNTTYTVTASDANGCVGSDQMVISVKDLPVVTAGPDAAVCEGNRVVLSASGGNTYLWSPANNLSDPHVANPAASPTETTTYIVAGTGPNGCSGTDTTIITIWKNPVASAGPDKVITEGSFITLDGSASGDNLAYRWTPNTDISNDTTLRPEVSPKTNTTYTLTVTSAHDCPASTDDVLVKVIPGLHIPNAFSPNGDGANDRWNLPWMRSYPGSIVRVFDRLGKVVYEARGEESPSWDGKYNGRVQPIGGFTYSINLNNGTPVLSGVVFLIR